MPTFRQLVELEPEHGRTSCSDDRPVNWYTTPGRGGWPRCTRCALLKAMTDEDFASTLKVRVEVQLPIE